VNREERIRTLILARWKSIRQFCLEIGIPPSTLRSALKPGKFGGMAIDYGILICEALGIPCEELKKKNYDNENKKS